MKPYQQTKQMQCGEFSATGQVASTGSQCLNQQMLQQQNRTYAGTAGQSEHNRHAGFLPAYQDMFSGRTELSRFADGRPAPIHLLEGLPLEWVSERDSDGKVAGLRAGIISGFLRDNCFFRREEVMRLLQSN